MMHRATDRMTEDLSAVEPCQIFPASALSLAAVQTGSSPLAGQAPLARERS